MTNPQTNSQSERQTEESSHYVIECESPSVRPSVSPTNQTMAALAADCIFYGGTIMTMDDACPVAQALATKDGKIMSVGSEDEVVLHRGADTKCISLEGNQTLLPGFIEAHQHGVRMTISRCMFVNCSGYYYQSYDQIKDLIEKTIANNVDSGSDKWCIFEGWDPELISDLPQLNWDILDGYSRDVPVIVLGQNKHVAWGNHKAFETAGVTEDTEDPDGGSFVRDPETKKLTGQMMESSAIAMLTHCAPAPSHKDWVTAVDQQWEQYSRCGFTTITELFFVPGLYDSLDSAIEAKSLRLDCPLRLALYERVGSVNEATTEKSPSTGRKLERILAKNDKLWFAGVKIFSDGSPHCGTAAAREPFLENDLTKTLGFPPSPCYGALNFSNDQLLKLVKHWHDQGKQVAIHAHGERAIDQVLDVYEKVMVCLRQRKINPSSLGSGGRDDDDDNGGRDDDDDNGGRDDDDDECSGGHDDDDSGSRDDYDDDDESSGGRDDDVVVVMMMMTVVVVMMMTMTVVVVMMMTVVVVMMMIVVLSGREDCDRRHRIEHLGLADENHIIRAAKLNLALSFFVAHLYFYGKVYTESILGEKRTNRWAPLSLATKHGLPWTIHQDNPAFPGPPEPFVNMKTAITRTRRGDPSTVYGKEYRVSIEEALKAYTINAAWQIHKEKMDFQHRAGGKTGSGGVASASESNRDRRERLRQLALETIDLNKDPYFMKNHLGSYECKLCLTLHNNEGSYLAHTQGKKHQSNLARRAAKEAKDAPAQPALEKPRVSLKKFVKIGRPGYKVTKQRSPDNGQHSLLFQIDYPEIAEAIAPRHRFMSAYEQRIEPPDKTWQYLLFAAEPYETIAFK
ncbi:hypothetical protein QZH41_017863, partial [Actinostola sp. cb2023]